MDKGVSLPFSVAAGVRVYLMDPVLAFIVPSSEAIKLSETYSTVSHSSYGVFNGEIQFGAGKNGALAMDLPFCRIFQT